MSVRIKLIGTGLLLCVALGATIFCAIQTVQAIQRFEETRNLTLSGDVSTISDWMTLPYVARVYHVPENYLDQWLHISNRQSARHATLRSLAGRLNRPVDSLIRDIQKAILTYRKQHAPHTGNTRPAKGPPSTGRKKP